jgi:glucosyl-3-phosphoglycerate phosphatase
MHRILLTRHGETDWNARGMLQGHTDIPLNELGRGQARALAARVAALAPAAVCTSDLMRAAETGDIVARALAVGEPTRDARLRERSFGVFEGRTRAACAAEYPEAWQAWQEHGASPPGAEPSDAVTRRFAEAVADVARRAVGTTLVVTHGGVMRLWLQQILARPVPLIGNGATYQVDWRDGTPSARILDGAA